MSKKNYVKMKKKLNKYLLFYNTFQSKIIILTTKNDNNILLH